MKILHTSDWHAGKAWKGQSRLDELAAVLDDLACVVERERVDLLIMAGDVFDTPSPSAEAERLVFGFFRRIGRLDVPSVVIAGNHDSPTRVDAWAQLAELARVTACGRVKAHDQGGCVRIPTRCGEVASVAMLPFVTPSRFISAQALGAAPDDAAAEYAVRMGELVADLARGFSTETVNLLVAHTHLEGAVLGSSERRVHVADEWAARPGMFPLSAQYVALGHIHRHQQVSAAGVPAWYAGAPMQLDFGEEGLPTCYNVVEVHPGRRARVEARPYVGARPLRTITVPASTFDGQRAHESAPAPPALAADALLRGRERRSAPPLSGSARATATDDRRSPGTGQGSLLLDAPADVLDLSDRPYLRVIVECPPGHVDADLNRKVRAALPGVVSVDLRRPAPEASEAAGPRLGTLAPRELYEAYLRQARGAVPSEAMLRAFDALHHDALAAEDET